jgi:predicted kinase
MATLHLICGLPGSGKSTLAKRIEAETGALRLAPDDWMIRLSLDAYDAEGRAAVEALQWGVAARCLASGLDVILENGFWTLADRDVYRVRGKAMGASVKLHFLDVSTHELVRRVMARNAALPPDAFAVNPEDIPLWAAEFEAPSAEELED